MKLKFLIIALLFVFAAKSQKLFKGTFEDGLEKIKKYSLGILLIESETCNKCNETADKGLNSILEKNDYRDILIIKANKIPPAIVEKNLHLLINNNFFGLLFINKKGDILSSISGSSSLPSFYENAIKKAVLENESENNLANLKFEYLTKTQNNFEIIYRLVQKSLELNLEASELISTELIKLVTADSASSISFLQFVSSTAPLLNSEAYKYVHKNKDNFNMAWYRLDLNKRQQINRRINHKSMQKAIATNNRNYAYQIANFVKNTYGESEQANDAYSKSLMDFFKGVNDTMAYLSFAINYYSNFNNKLNVDSIRSADSKPFKTKIDTNFSKPRSTDSLVVKKLVTRTIAFSPKSQAYANTLNEGAWLVYKYSKSKSQLLTALEWSKKAVALYENAEVLDTYARILYVTGNKEEAIVIQQKAVEANKKIGYGVNSFELLLQKMKNGEDIIGIE